MITRMSNEIRTLVLVDVENLHGGTDFVAADVRAMRHRVEEAAGLTTTTQAVVATSSGSALVEAGLGWEGSRRVWMRGRDGADLALADVACNENVASRYDRVVICSGDGLFAVVARYLITTGIHITVVACSARLSRKLAQVADDVHLLDDALGKSA